MVAQLPRFIAHRFGRAYGPDSSLSALEHALSKPIGGLETDCCLTADGEIVLVHDSHLPDSTTLTGWARERTLSEIVAARLRDAHGRATDEAPLSLPWLLERLEQSDLILQLEVKAFADADLADVTSVRVCELVAAAPETLRARVEVISFWPGAVALAARRGLSARVIVACPYRPNALAEWAGAEGISGVVLEASYWSEPVVRIWREVGLSIMSGAVNDIALLSRVLPFGPDAVSTDRPHELREDTVRLLGDG